MQKAAQISIYINLFTTQMRIEASAKTPDGLIRVSASGSPRKNDKRVPPHLEELNLEIGPIEDRRKKLLFDKKTAEFSHSPNISITCCDELLTYRQTVYTAPPGEQLNRAVVLSQLRHQLGNSITESTHFLALHHLLRHFLFNQTPNPPAGNRLS